MKTSELQELQAHAQPCPFCGSGAKLAPLPNASGWWRVRCNAGQCGGTTWAIQGATEAVAAWNRRPSNGAP